jgi:hypothetical protein
VRPVAPFQVAADVHRCGASTGMEAAPQLATVVAVNKPSAAVFNEEKS